MKLKFKKQLFGIIGDSHQLFKRGGAERAKYGTKLLPRLAERLTAEFVEQSGTGTHFIFVNCLFR